MDADFREWGGRLLVIGERKNEEMEERREGGMAWRGTFIGVMIVRLFVLVGLMTASGLGAEL